MSRLGRDVRKLDSWMYERVDAYPSWNGSRDVGGGREMPEWLDEIEEFADAQREALSTAERPDGRHSRHPRGPERRRRGPSPSIAKIFSAAPVAAPPVQRSAVRHS